MITYCPNTFSSKKNILETPEKKRLISPIKHTLTIGDYFFEGKDSKIVMAFAKAYLQNDFIKLSKYIAKDIVFVINNKETIYGKYNCGIRF